MTDDTRRSASPRAEVVPSDTESVLIDGTAYTVPAAVAGEMLRLHMELRATTQPQQAPARTAADAPAGVVGALRDAREALDSADVRLYYEGFIDESEPRRDIREAIEGIDAALATIPDAPAAPVQGEVLVLLIAHDGDDTPSVALARNRAELLEQVKVAVWGEPHPADTTNDAGDDMAEGMTDALLEEGVMTFEGDPPLRLVRIGVPGWFPASFEEKREPVLRSDFDHVVQDLNRAKALIVDMLKLTGLDHPAATLAHARTGAWLMFGHNRDRGDLHPRTVDLVDRFAVALKAKLAAAEKKYGYSDGWASPDWLDECRQHLREHVDKGDPRDVAAYCAFLWHHGASAAAPAGGQHDI